jgi:hypothetical protein
MLNSGKPIIFALFSVFIHALFALLFSRITLSFNPPEVRNVSLMLMTSGTGQSDIIQKEAVWSAPARLEPAFPVTEVLSDLESTIPQWMSLDRPEALVFAPRESLLPQVDINHAAEQLRPRCPIDIFAAPPAESKPMPTAEFALGSDFPDLFGKD